MNSPLLDPLLMAQLGPLELAARRVADGALAGRHKGRRKGQALEFSGHRPYTPSDDWRRIDWKAYAKTDRWVLREQEEETNLRVLLLLDASGSMAYGPPDGVTKFRYASVLCAALAFLLTGRREAVGLGLFGENLRLFLPPRGGRAALSEIVRALEHSPAEGTTDYRGALEEAGQKLSRRTLVLVVSDFLGAPENILPPLKTIAAHRHEVLALQVLHADERLFPFDGERRFEDLETGQTVSLRAGELAAEYRLRMTRRLAAFARALASAGMDYQLFETHRALAADLSLFLERRRRK